MMTIGDVIWPSLSHSVGNKAWGISKKKKTTDIMATTVAKSIKLNFICNPGVLCLPPTFIKLW